MVDKTGLAHPVACNSPRVILLLGFVCFMLIGTMVLWVARPRHRSRLPVTYEAMRVDLNTADIDTLVLLPGIGRNLAERIIKYRKFHCPFGSVEQLQAVHGIGQ